MSDELKLHDPWLVAVWPGMGHVASSAGYYLMAQLGVHMLAEFSPRELFDLESVEVKNGIMQPVRLPRSRFFLWRDPQERRDILIFIGEAQPPIGRYTFCRKLVDYAKQAGVTRVFTFAAMATEMHPEHESRVFAAATDDEMLASLKARKLELIEDGHISGLNGVLVGVAAEAGLRGACLLGEMPHIFSQLPFPKASLAVLKVFAEMARLEIDFSELVEQSRAMSHRLGELLSEAQKAIENRLAGESGDDDDEQEFQSSLEDEEMLDPADEQRIEQLFEQARSNRSKAYELKSELDRLEVFDQYEDRFLDLFKK
jgi:proteasome assembly chaperone (PAC2) family protein